MPTTPWFRLCLTIWSTQASGGACWPAAGPAPRRSTTRSAGRRSSASAASRSSRRTGSRWCCRWVTTLARCSAPRRVGLATSSSMRSAGTPWATRSPPEYSGSDDTSSRRRILPTTTPGWPIATSSQRAKSWALVRCDDAWLSEASGISPAYRGFQATVVGSWPKNCTHPWCRRSVRSARRVSFPNLPVSCSKFSVEVAGCRWPAWVLVSGWLSLSRSVAAVGMTSQIGGCSGRSSVGSRAGPSGCAGLRRRADGGRLRVRRGAPDRALTERACGVLWRWCRFSGPAVPARSSMSSRTPSPPGSSSGRPWPSCCPRTVPQPPCSTSAASGVRIGSRRCW